ncbi:hypothetical protein HK102_011914, partial [Quaeritorhiza haematococci]
ETARHQTETATAMAAAIPQFAKPMWAPEPTKSSRQSGQSSKSRIWSQHLNSPKESSDILELSENSAPSDDANQE